MKDANIVLYIAGKNMKVENADGIGYEVEVEDTKVIQCRRIII